MKIRLTIVAAALLFAQQVQARTDALPQAAALANSTSPASTSQAFGALEMQILQAQRNALKGAATTLTRDQLEKAKQTDTQADRAWLKASGYDFQTRANQQAGIELLSAFSALPDSTLLASSATVASINLNAVQGARHQALADAEGISYLYYLADALGPRLGQAFLAAYDKGELSKAAALIKASEVSTSAAKKHFNYPRPFLVKGNSIHLVPDDVVVKDNQPYTADGGSFPSGHTNTGYTDALLLAEMVPERFDALMERGARYGYSRIVLGVHYPLDIIGSRMVVQRNVAHYLNDPHYHALFNEARDQLRSALEKECGTSLAECAQTAGQDDPYRSPAMKDFYRFTMSYGLPQQQVSPSRVVVPDGAEVLLETALPRLSAAQRRALMVNSALPAGYPLSGSTADQAFWQRLDLSAAFALAKPAHSH
ncbi:phosphatase PAP2 family protein [Erwiniaceae bacterium BAC15a-03b]|uniref:Phosphatase PAP2 family protein n=1 Tax=Winslowiella arboricola TaxID=2978220 RepID=A0A9J6PMY9_9GAMM|nr:phosphatase PAP2 family protein [Winslowiella arboricola]MCU5771667.1 phosphatase PAP2 family protein [Winslowiella arboricola]MCU5778142.1 phosphatase PAP2 family protein [Winslowiella arboricola]